MRIYSQIYKYNRTIFLSKTKWSTLFITIPMNNLIV